jgi:phage-related protein
MLDNLKLGYGGTKSEMERLLKDAQALTGVKYDINNLSDVYEALCCIAIKLVTMMSIFEKIDKEIDKRHGV